MKVALYTYHHYLPFWHTPSNPYCLYDPRAISGWTFISNQWDDSEKKFKMPPISEHSMIPVLNGLYAIKLSRVMAHVSIILDFNNKTLKLPKRTWVQISTLPKVGYKKNPPLIVKNGKVQVQHLWGGDNGTYHPYGLLDEEERRGGQINTANFWSKFFLAKLRQTKIQTFEHLHVAIAEANECYERFKVVPW